MGLDDTIVDWRTDNQEEPPPPVLPYYFFHMARGEVLLPDEELPKNKSSLLMILNRRDMFFNELPIKTKKKMKIAEILAIQRNYIPFKDEFLNVIYSLKFKKKTGFFFWISPAAIIDQQHVFDDVPESFIFKGDPKKIKDYNVFVFRRVSGFEVLYFNGEKFFSSFEIKRELLPGKIMLMARKYSNLGPIKVLSDEELPELMNHFSIELVDDPKRYFYLPSYYPFVQVFSNLARDKKAKTLKSTVSLTGKYLNILWGLLFLAFLVTLYFRVDISGKEATIRDQYKQVRWYLAKSQKKELHVNQLREKVSAYKDHLAFLKFVSDAFLEEEYVTEISLVENKLTLKIFAPNALALQNRLKANALFQDVRITSRVDKDLQTQKETFVLELLLKGAQ